jgi:GntR family transcriptional regulator of vanillate catabolism
MQTIQLSVTEQLRAKILNGEFLPGSRLHEGPLAEMMDVSRTPIRAALIALAQEGLLNYRPQRGYVVRKISLKEVLNAYTVRGRLEGLACRLAAEQGVTEETLRILRECLAEGDRILSSGVLTDEGHDRWVHMNERLHQTILAASDNSLLVELTARTLSFPLTSARVVHWVDYPAMRRSHDHHWAIVDAIERRQPSRAEAIMVEHIFISSDYIRARFNP